MSTLEVIRRILPFGILFPSYDGIEEYIDAGLEWSNTNRAENIASRVRDNGIKRYGPMWAEYNGLLRDGREVFLQASDDALVVHIASKGRGNTNVHIRWDRKQKIVNSLLKVLLIVILTAGSVNVFAAFEVALFGKSGMCK